ncbi:amidohydrolase family protein [Rathayibacter sp. VKM Ac-2928]|uniref:amidohydrolase family protein n=1 Tax=Rathayibacter sp. VKM Ac-2928 TaxID=2929479 RepID=UPI001FB5590B|nr:amidohydrolase family protein [Rathayibacter sp. VKM Ac-2928]MCJ1685349.1 hypothetical protein [Rathayibacter sp. VKM Ac-2928]
MIADGLESGIVLVQGDGEGGFGVHDPVQTGFSRTPTASGLPTDLVIDHMGRIPAVTHPAFAAVMDFIDEGQARVKLPGVYHESPEGPPSYSDRSAVGAAFASAAPERML